MASSKQNVPTEWDIPKLRSSFVFLNESKYLDDNSEAQGTLTLVVLPGDGRLTRT